LLSFLSSSGGTGAILLVDKKSLISRNAEVDAEAAGFSDFIAFVEKMEYRQRRRMTPEEGLIDTLLGLMKFELRNAKMN
jgi:hypothetical protein